MNLDSFSNSRITKELRKKLTCQETEVVRSSHLNAIRDFLAAEEQKLCF